MINSMTFIPQKQHIPLENMATSKILPTSFIYTRQINYIIHFYRTYFQLYTETEALISDPYLHRLWQQPATFSQKCDALNIRLQLWILQTITPLNLPPKLSTKSVMFFFVPIRQTGQFCWSVTDSMKSTFIEGKGPNYNICLRATVHYSSSLS